MATASVPREGPFSLCCHVGPQRRPSVPRAQLLAAVTAALRVFGLALRCSSCTSHLVVLTSSRVFARLLDLLVASYTVFPLLPLLHLDVSQLAAFVLP
jgi:small neutral amino acid transporter SnatA (MarC family)